MGHRPGPAGTRIWRLALAAAAGLALAAPTSGQAAVTIGSDLAADGANAGACNSGSCTAAMTTMAGAPVASPINGVVTHFSVRPGGTDIGGNDIRLRVLRPAGGGAFLGVNSSVTTHITTGGLTRTATGQRIAAGDTIGLDLDTVSANFTISTATPESGTTLVRWEPQLGNGSSLTPTPPSPFSDTTRFQLNAEIEPDADCDGLGDETQDAAVAGGCLPAGPVAPIASPPISSRKKCKKGRKLRRGKCVRTKHRK